MRLGLKAIPLLLASLAAAANANELIDAAKLADQQQVAALLASGSDSNSTDSKGYSALFYASIKGHSEVVDALLAAGANVNAAGRNGWQPLHGAAFHGHDAVVGRLLAAGAAVNAQDSQGQSPLLLAAQFGHAPVVKRLLQRQAEVALRNHQGDTALALAVKNLHAAVVDALLAQPAALAPPKRQPLLFYAVGSSSATMFERLLAAGVKPEARAADGVDLLAYAAVVASPDLLQTVLSQYSPRAITPAVLNTAVANAPLANVLQLYQQAEPSLQPLALVAASANGRLNVVEALLQQGAAIDAVANYQDHAITALMAAARYRHDWVVDALLKAGANPALTDAQQRNALHWAAAAKPAKERTVALLLAAGTNREAMDSGGLTAADLANHAHGPEREAVLALLSPAH